MGKELDGEACVVSGLDDEECSDRVYADGNRRNVWIDSDVPEEATVKYEGSEHKAEKCTLAFGNEALCWEKDEYIET